MDFTPLHESAHLIIETEYWNRKGLSHNIQSIIIDGIRSKVRMFDLCTAADIKEVTIGNIPLSIKKNYIRYGEHKQRVLMAGFAAEANIFSYTGIHFPELVKSFYKGNESAESDFKKAIEFNVALGRQEESDGILPLAKAFNKALREVRGHWELINWTAKQIEGGGIIEGIRLERLMVEIQKRLKKSTE